MARISRIAVIGLGRIGLPHALVLADSGFTVYGVDKNAELVESLRRGRPPFYEPGMAGLLRRYLGERFYPTTVLGEAVRGADAVSINIGTIVDRDKRTRIDNLMGLIDSLVSIGLDGKLVILRTTVPLGTTERIRDYIERRTGMREGRDFYIAYMPERLVEGRAIEEERRLPKIIGAFTDESYRLASEIASVIGGPVIRASSPTEAELVKLIDNSWRQLTFAFANDIALLAETRGLDAVHAIRLANTAYPRNNIPLPSYGVSGYCLSKDPYILEQAFNEVRDRRGFGSIWYYGRLVNDYMVRYAVDLLTSLLEKHHGGRGPVCVLGLSYKENIDDFRLSHGVEMANTLYERGLGVRVYDPYISPGSPYTDPRRFLHEGVEAAESIEKCLEDSAAAAVTVRHREFVALEESGAVHRVIDKMRKPAIIVDGWRVFESLKHRSDVIYRGVGYGGR